VKKVATTEQTTIIDAKRLVLGRMASIIANRLLKGETIIVVNAEKAVISGKKQSKVKETKTFMEVGHPKKGPFHPRRPDQIVRRTIRGMLPRKKPKGKQAYKRLRVFIEVPEELKGKEIQTIPEVSADNLKCPYITVGELAKEIGWTPLVGE
jgi:large subunit ribosomal protein L13